MRRRCIDADHRGTWRREELVLDRETLDGIIRMLTAISAKLDRLLGEDEDEDAEEHGS